MPWGRIDDTLYDHPKLDLLPAPERLAAVGLNYLAVSWCNRFLTDGDVPAARVDKLGGTIELAEILVRAGLWERLRSGYRIHDFLVYNDRRADVIARREKEAERKARWRAARLSKAGPVGTTSGTDAGTDIGTHDGTDTGTNRGRPPSVPRFPPRANPGPARPVPVPDSLREENRTYSAGEDAAPEPSERDDIAALLERWPKVTASQRRRLDEILDRHDVTGSAWAAGIIRATPADADPLAAVLAADKAWQAEQRARVDAEEAAWQRQKDEDRAQAGPTDTSWFDPPAEALA